MVLLLLAWPGFAPPCEGLNGGYRRAFKLELLAHLQARTKYVWGGTDCSGLIADAARKAGLPTSRITAKGMALGRGGWFGIPVTFEGKKELDLIWWDLKKSRPYGHVGVVWGENQALHSSGSRGHVVVDNLIGGMRTKISLIKRLLIGG